MGEKINENTQATLVIDFLKSHGYRVYEIHGAWGGVTSLGEIQMDFYVDKAKLPERLIQDLDEKGIAVREERIPPTPITERVVQFGCLMSPSVARQLAEFLLKQAGSIERVTDPRNNDWPNVRSK